MKAILFVLFSFCVFSLLAQSDNKHSIGVDAGYLSPLNKETTNYFNYGFSFLMSERVFQRIKLSLGINYSSISMYKLSKDQFFRPDILKEYQYDAKYLNFPFIISYIINSEKKFKIDPYIGAIASKVISYDYIYYQNYQIDQPHVTQVPDKLGWYFRTGINVSKSINRHFVLNVSPYLDILVVKYAKLDAKSSYPPMGDFTFGYKLGLDYGW